MSDFIIESDLTRLKNVFIAIIIAAFVRLGKLNTLIDFLLWGFVMWCFLSIFVNYHRTYKRGQHPSRHFVLATLTTVVIVVLNLVSCIALVLPLRVTFFNNSVVSIFLTLILPSIFFLLLCYAMQEDFIRWFSDDSFAQQLMSTWERCALSVIIAQGIAIIGRLLISIKALDLLNQANIEAIQTLRMPNTLFTIVYCLPIGLAVVNINRTLDFLRNQTFVVK